MSTKTSKTSTKQRSGKKPQSSQSPLKLSQIKDRLRAIKRELFLRSYPEFKFTDWFAHERQQLFFDLDVDEALYGGAAGGGKSDALIMWMVMRRLRHPGSRGIMFRRTYPELEESLIMRSQELIPPSIATYNEQKKRWKFKNGSSIKFGYLERDKDVTKYQSAQYDDIAFDELTHFSRYQYTYMASRNRATVPGIRPMRRAATNPGGIGHGWVKERFINAAPPGTIIWDAETKEHRCFIPAKVQDNPHIMGRDAQYVNRLNALGDEEKKALRDGDWDVFSGQYFTEWSRDIHVVEPFTIPATWQRKTATDYGFHAPMCTLWGAEDPDGNIYIYRELYREKVYEHDQPKMIADLSVGEHVSLRVGDPSMWSKTGREATAKVGESVADTYAKNGWPIQPADNNRIAGWKEVREFLRHVTGSDGLPTARLKVFSTCTNLIRTLPEQIHDKKNVEDMNTEGEDHAPDALRYIVMLPKASKLPKETKDRTAITSGQRNTRF